MNQARSQAHILRASLVQSVLDVFKIPIVYTVTGSLIAGLVPMYVSKQQFKNLMDQQIETQNSIRRLHEKQNQTEKNVKANIEGKFNALVGALEGSVRKLKKANKRSTDK